MTLHVAHRAERLLGYGIVLLDVFDPDDYGLSGIYAYRNALGNEPAALEAEPFTAILKTCPPRPFVELWLADVDRWLSGIDSPTPDNARPWWLRKTCFLFERSEPCRNHRPRKRIVIASGRLPTEQRSSPIG